MSFWSSCAKNALTRLELLLLVPASFGFGILLLLSTGCRSSSSHSGPTISFVLVPPNQAGGPELLDRVGGTVTEAPHGSRIVVYARNGTWWVQPFRSHPFTEVAGSGNWSSATHLGTDYAALLVAPGYQPPANFVALPSIGGYIQAVATTGGSSGRLSGPASVHFSGYDWNVNASATYRGGELSEYEPANAWVDDQGFLHLLMNQEEGRWHCAGVRLTRSLGYGTYRFVVRDTAHLPPSAVLTLYTRDGRQDQADAAEMDIELSHWGRKEDRNADYVVQPYYIPENTVHFNVPSGLVTHVLRWEPESAVFSSFAGSLPPGQKITEHAFGSGVPVPAAETVHLDLYDFYHSKSGLQHPVEVVVEKFEYLP